MVREDQGFYLHDGDVDFNSRQKSVFGELDRLEASSPRNKYSESELNSGAQKTFVAPHKKTMLKQFKGKGSIFKRPDLPLRKNFKVLLPDYAKNPHKWRKYTLSDTPEDVMTDASNRSAAMSFLRGLKGESSTGSDVVKEPPKKVLFNKEIKSKPKPYINEDKMVYAKNKFLMPEYVVGQKVVKKTKEKPSPSEVSHARVTLSHLEDEVEETN